ncbi:hypothetical protein Y032_0038g3600 [Ancylostoma ceylanicum]|uniref:HEAT repeat protein n=1 Tax=Ancylostoma ceylanicum TaxID=53326 RepID=A0A016UIS3_9BILA|nr:hypothetical protein Y032_0038g3600 [Ancylostoma ceylanicum]
MFFIQILQQSSDPCEVEGALRMIGELNHQLTKSKKYKKDVERMLDALIISRLRDHSKFVRARAAWCLKEYSDAHFHTKSIIVKFDENFLPVLESNRKREAIKDVSDPPAKLSKA